MSADLAYRRAQREGRSAYVEAVRAGIRRPWTPRQVLAAQIAVREGYDGAPFSETLPLLCGRTWDESSIAVKPPPGPLWNRCRTRFQAWAQRVLRETAELEGA